MLGKKLLKTIYKKIKGKDYSIGLLIPEFLDWLLLDLNLSPQTINKHEECLGHVILYIGDMDIRKLTVSDVLEMKRKMNDKKLSSARRNSILFALRKLLRYCQEEKGVRVIDPSKIKPLRIPKRAVIYLTNEEVHKFVGCIGTSKMYGLRFRTLVEVLLTTGMRISEALSLNRNDIDFNKGEAVIVGKNNKERIVYFNNRSLKSINMYLKRRWDKEDPLFVTHCLPKRWSCSDARMYFLKYRKVSGISKKITPHIIRHSVATNLLFNGADITFIKEILGHEDIKTTCKYYLGLDKRKVKEAHKEYLNFNN